MEKKEYIEREALIAEYDRVHQGPAGGARKLMVDAPAADVVEVRHGEWLEYWDDNYLSWAHTCSECGEFPLTKDGTMNDEVLSRYCPNCGAKMDGGSK